MARRAETVADTDDHGRGTKTDARHQRSGAARSDKARQRAYNEGVKHGKASRIHQRRPDPDDTQSHGHAGPQYEQGYSAGRKQASSDRRTRAVGAVRSAATSGNDVTGFVLAVLSWAVFINYVRGGTAGVDAWFKAKFFNEAGGVTPTTGTVPTSAQSVAAATAAGGGGGGPRLNQ